MTDTPAVRNHKINVEWLTAALDHWWNFDDETGLRRTSHAELVSIIPSMVAQAVAREYDRIATSCKGGAWPCLEHDRHVLKAGRYYPGATPEEYGPGDWEPAP